MALTAVLLLLMAGCRVDATVDVEVTDDGSGTVSVEAIFDEAASLALGGTEGIAEQLFVSDLAAAGWAVTRPEVGADGATRIVASKDVPDRDQFQAVLDEIAGPGVFRDVTIETSDAFAEHRQSLSFDIDLSQGWDLFSDEGVAAALDGEPFGVPIEQLTDGRPIDEIIGVTVDASVVGDDGETPSAATYAPRFDGPPVEVRLEALVEQSTAVLLRWIAYALASLFVLSLLLAITGLWLQRRAERLRPQATPAQLRTRIPGASTATEPTRASASRGSGRAATRPRDEGPVRLVVVEPLSVLFQQSEPPENYLLPFVRHNGGETRADLILESYEDLLRGRIETDDFWPVTGVEGAAAETDRVFMEMRWLRKEAPAFLKELERRRIPIAAVSNDASAWSQTVRERERMTAVWPWLVSGDVGATKPDTGMFELLRRETGTAYAHCLYIDTRVEHLDAARDLGMRTALYNADGLDVPPLAGHPVVTDLLQLVRRSAR